MKILTMAVLIVSLLTSCKEASKKQPMETTIPTELPSIPGMFIAKSNLDFNTTYKRLKDALASNSKITIMAEVDHKKNANSIGVKIENSRVLFFGNPALGTPLMQENQQAGLDLPQRIIVFTDATGTTYIACNDTSFLSSRHRIAEVSSLAIIKNALKSLINQASQQEGALVNTVQIPLNYQVTTFESTRSFEETFSELVALIDKNPNLKMMAQVDHTANASSVNQTLPPTAVLIFGNPKLGTPLQQASQTAGFDLPQKMLIYEDEAGKVTIAFNNPALFIERHAVTGQDAILKKVEKALTILAKTAGG